MLKNWAGDTAQPHSAYLASTWLSLILSTKKRKTLTALKNYQCKSNYQAKFEEIIRVQVEDYCFSEEIY